MNDKPLASSVGRRSIAAQAFLSGRAALSRSFRLHRPRGAFCQGGWCQQCKVKLADGAVVLACQQACGDADGAALQPRTWFMSLIGPIVERQPPWFYESHFLRPAVLRQFYLNALRRLSGALPLPERCPTPGTPWRELDCDVLVVGGGLAGLRAAKEFRAANRSVIVVDASRRFGKEESALSQERTSARDAGCGVLLDTVCVGLYESPRRALCVDDAGSMRIAHRELVVATGAYDRLILFPNNDLPGIVGVRAFEILLAQSAVPPRYKIGIYGEVLEVARALEALNKLGRRAAWIAGPSRSAESNDDIRWHPETYISRADGTNRIGSVTLSRVGRLECDMLVLAFSQPGYELQMQRQAKLVLDGRPSQLTPEVSFIDLLVVGEAAGDVDLDAKTALAHAEGRTKEWLHSRKNLPRPRCAEHNSFPSAPAEALVCPCEDVRVRDVRSAIAEGYNDIESIKRRTGAATGPCQGKLCHANLMDCVVELGVDARLPTQRPLVRPITFAQFAGASEQ